jgi:hypothetical protein
VLARPRSEGAGASRIDLADATNSCVFAAHPGMLASVADLAIDIFISYAHADEALRCRLDSHLGPLVRQGLIRPWHRGLLGADEERSATAATRLAQARIILLLVSADFLADDECGADVEQARRRLLTSGGARVIPILLRPCDWSAAAFAFLTPLPAGGEPLASSPDPEIAWADVAARIEQAVAVTRLTRPSVTPGQPRRASAAGQVRVSGVVLRSMDRTLIDERGRSARDQVVAQMPEHCRDDLRHESIDLLARYELETLTTYMDLATSLVLRDPERWRDFGRLAVSGDLHQFVRSVYAVPTVNVVPVLHRTTSILSCLFTSGSWRVDTGFACKVALTIGDLGPPSVLLRLWIAGVMEEIVRRAMSSDVKWSITHGESRGAPELTCEISL